MKISFIWSLLLLSACNIAPEKNLKTADDKDSSLRGIYKLISLQSQEDTVFAPMPGVEILKIFTESQWISPAYLLKNKKVVNLAGGTYSYSNGQLTETLHYHSKDTINIGLSTTFRIRLKNDTLYQSGVFKPGTAEEYKVEEYWIKVE
ncbi:MAG TPA: hypothetical protein VNW99_07305 [Cytophagaceae bacterium]|jgi:hypothetical protein|nr:hypothetical protein [Cytophagaceae bacterium]